MLNNKIHHRQATQNTTGKVWTFKRCQHDQTHGHINLKEINANGKF
jgi:hypothetical protein